MPLLKRKSYLHELRADSAEHQVGDWFGGVRFLLIRQIINRYFGANIGVFSGRI